LLWCQLTPACPASQSLLDRPAFQRQSIAHVYCGYGVVSTGYQDAGSGQRVTQPVCMPAGCMLTRPRCAS
jgi:hypothetical protein